MTSLLKLAEREGIVVEYWDFSPPLEAVYWWSPGLPPVIGLANSLEHQLHAYQRCVLAEELGHHFLHQGNHCYLHSLWLDKQEREAEMFAAILLVPPGAIDKMLCWTPKRIEDAFAVPRELAVIRYRVLELKGC